MKHGTILAHTPEEDGRIIARVRWDDGTESDEVVEIGPTQQFILTGVTDAYAEKAEPKERK